MRKNCFHPEEWFFIIDSNNLPEVSSRLYGFCIQDDGIVDEEAACKGKQVIPGGRGAYVLIQRMGDKIEIYQDFVASYGLYLFRDGEYFAISNSFVYLVDYIKTKHVISLNQDYANAFMLSELSSFVLGDTMVNEIEQLRKNAVVDITVSKRSLNIRHIDYRDASLEINSREAMDALDSWYYRWLKIFRGVGSADNVQIDLSGGIDSRLTLLLALKSGIDMNSLYVNSDLRTTSTYAEDYEIAQEIASSYGFSLNTRREPEKAAWFSLEDALNIAFYTQLTLHTGWYNYRDYLKTTKYRFTGFGGECLRGYQWGWYPKTRDTFENKFMRRFYPSNLRSDEMALLDASIHRVCDAVYSEIQKKYCISDPQSESIAQKLYCEIGQVNHFGKVQALVYHRNCFCMSPLLDPELQMVKISDAKCPDTRLLVAVIFTRYFPELLDFRFDSNRVLAPETIEYAKQINAKYPIGEEPEPVATESFTVPASRLYEADCDENEELFAEEAAQYIQRLCTGKRFRDLFTSYFPEAMYQSFVKHEKSPAHNYLQQVYAMVGVVKIINDVEFSEAAMCGGTLADSLGRLHKNVSGLTVYDELEVYRNTISKLRDDILARIEAKILGDTPSELDILSVSDSLARVRKPEWFQRNGTGYVVESCKLSVQMKFQCRTEGTIEIKIGGRKDHKYGIVPHWIDVTHLSYNGEAVLNERTPVWYDEPYVLRRTVKAGETVTLDAEWGVHRAEA